MFYYKLFANDFNNPKTLTSVTDNRFSRPPKQFRKIYRHGVWNHANPSTPGLFVFKTKKAEVLWSDIEAVDLVESFIGDWLFVDRTYHLYRVDVKGQPKKVHHIIPMGRLGLMGSIPDWQQYFEVWSDSDDFYYRSHGKLAKIDYTDPPQNTYLVPALKIQQPIGLIANFHFLPATGTGLLGREFRYSI